MLGTTLLQRLGALAEGTCRINNVVDDDSRFAIHITDEIHDLGTARLRTALLDNGNGSLQMVC